MSPPTGKSLRCLFLRPSKTSNLRRDPCAQDWRGTRPGLAPVVRAASVVLSVLPNFAFVAGRVVPYRDANVGILTLALNYGSAVFGGLRAYWNDDEKQLFIFRPQDHFTRFLQSAK